MTDESIPSADMAQQVLAATDQLTRRVRQAQRGTWFPLALLGLVVVAAAPFYRLGRHTVTCDPVLGARGGVEIIDRGACIQVVGWPSGVYWILALVLAYAAIAAFYVSRARSRGVGSRVLPYVGSGIAAGLVFGVASAWTPQLKLGGLSPAGPVAIGLIPLVAISLALFVLARVERSWAVLAFAVGYLAVALLAYGIRTGPAWGLPVTWGFLPSLLFAGGVLLLGGAGFGLAERRRA
ncbi:hypothetical protein GCM10027176_28950 [Actinoallomurus bryophytorum]|uniref:Uncharacterized protein n=1 Tax=Actinoallomurus bryophytorum TaxID=1490222 RepID=A0A543CGL4_9ACTN|nr:cytochrome d ubiquinol oxidase subunit II [Actinoallomurus bryophytorum]TQL96242.1 hypothetical protein FB559_1766 [Actinoallomurus bryophytorum]